MPKESSTLPLNLHQPKAGVPLYRWLYEELRSAILAGHLRSGGRLPATRELAAQYGLSRPTVVTAFEQLRSEGYVDGKIGSGTYVSKTLPEELLQTPLAKEEKRGVEGRIRLSGYARRLRQARADLEKQIPRGLKPSRNDKGKESGSALRVSPLRGARLRPARAFRGGEALAASFDKSACGW